MDFGYTQEEERFRKNLCTFLDRELTEEIARQTLSLYFEPDRGVVPRQGEIDVKGFNEVIKVMAEVGELKPPLPTAERFIDLQYLKAAGIQ